MFVIVIYLPLELLCISSRYSDSLWSGWPWNWGSFSYRWWICSNL